MSRYVHDFRVIYRTRRVHKIAFLYYIYIYTVQVDIYIYNCYTVSNEYVLPGVTYNWCTCGCMHIYECSSTCVGQ